MMMRFSRKRDRLPLRRMSHRIFFVSTDRKFKTVPRPSEVCAYNTRNVFSVTVGGLEFID